MHAPIPVFQWRQLAIPAFGPSLLFGLCEGIILPILALSARQLGASLAVAGLVVALLGLGSLLANVPAARLTVRFGERRAMIGAAGVVFIGLLLCLQANSVWMLGTGVVLIGLARAVFMLARQAFLVEATPAHWRARAMAMLGGVHRIGMFAGPFLGALCIHGTGSLAGGYWAALVVMAATGVLAWKVPELAHPPSAATGRPEAAPPTALQMLRGHRQVFLTLGIATALVAAIRAARQVIVPLWAGHIGLDAAAAALIYGCMGAVDMALFYPAGKWMDQRGRRFVALPSMLVMGASLVLLPFATSFGALLAVGVALGIGNGMGAGIVLTIGADASPQAGRTQFLGLWRLIIDMGNGGGPLLVAGLTSLATLAAGIVGIGGLGFISAWMFWRWLPRRHRNRE
ncbi:MFS transporter [Comamonas nitrativorans]|uniref:MFS transporter n=1 Tax=Comamonas nitrativorans TaxID=108437 RepID=A0ABV9GXN9_9BURK